MIETHDTIVAVASAPGSAPRGVVRLSGPGVASVLAALAQAPVPEHRVAQALGSVPLRITLDGAERTLPCDVLVWPDGRSYTGQAAAEVHTIGSAAVLAALVAECVRAGARLASPGEFTLRAVLAGRMDLVQAEAVLAVIDARGGDELDAALGRLAGGLSRPLAEVRAGLVDLLVDLEAGLDFVDEEGVRFITPGEVADRIDAARGAVSAALAQAASRGDAGPRPTVVLVGPPNVGKSSLFNALVDRFGIDPQAPRAIVADLPGVTRDPVTARVRFGATECELVDTAGLDAAGLVTPQRRSDEAMTTATLVVACQAEGLVQCIVDSSAERVVQVSTRCDVAPPAEGALATSAVSGEGIDRLAAVIADRLATHAGHNVASGASDRARGGLERAATALAEAALVHATGAGEELVSLELRAALAALGEVVGDVTSDEVLAEVFARFCIGK